MIASFRDPAAMTPTERRSEVAFLLATGYLRLLVHREKALELPGKAEALCAAPVDGRKSAPPEKESA